MMDFGSLSKREAQLFLDGYAEGMKTFGDAIDLMEPLFGDSVPRSEIKKLADYLYEGHMNSTLRKIDAIYDIIEGEKIK